MPFVLYVRADCHLCTLAKEVLHQCEVVAKTESLDGNAWLETNYGTRIPVLTETNSGRELDWPFDAWTLRRFLDPT